MQVIDSPASSKVPFSPDSPTLAKEIKIYLERHRDAVAELISAGDDRAGALASERWLKSFDGLLCALSCAIRSTVGDEKTWKSISLAAVGSYGRGNFSFRSDLDVRILCPKPAKAAPIAEALLYPLWDAGLQVGHQVVTIGDTLSLAKRDLATATTLLDWRHISGDLEQSQKLREKAFGGLFSPGSVHVFLQEMQEESEKRTARFGDSVYLLEPDVKNGQGGVRDIDIINWTAQARWRVKSLRELVDQGVLARAELSQLEDAFRFVARVRNILHFKSPRRSERLSFETQELVTEVMGYGKGGMACEAMMSDYYRHARAISNARESLFIRAQPRPKKKAKIDEFYFGVALSAQTVSVVDLDELHKNPVLILRVYWEAIHRNLNIDSDFRVAAARALTDEDVCFRLRSDAEAAMLFRRLVRKPAKVSFKRNSILSEFHDIGLLLAMIPEFAPVVGRVHHDIYHVYTVDVHSIAAVDRLRKFCRGELASEFPIASRLAADIARPQVLFMAVLLHDIGKDLGGSNHSERGCDLARSILTRLGVQEHDIIEIQHLVLKHLRMYHVASRRDLDDPQTIVKFSSEVHGPEGLKELYLLTLCDVATTSPSALSQWKTRMLEELYVQTLRLFDGQPTRTEERAENLRSIARTLCPEKGEADFLNHFLDTVPNRYLYANEPTQVAGHARLARQSEGRRAMVEILGIRNYYVEVGFITDDKPGVLAMITAALSANRLTVVAAQLYSWVDRDGRKRVLDIFWVRNGTDAEMVKRQMARLRDDLELLVSGQMQPDELLASRRSTGFSDRPSPDVPVTVTFDNLSSHAHTVIEVMAEDRMGLLYRLAKTLKDYGLEIALAKINTEGNAVADVFYVCDQEGRKIEDPEQLKDLHERLRVAVLRTVT